MISLSTHVLDTVSGAPADCVRFRLFFHQELLFEGITDSDGRSPALRELVLQAGLYRLEFDVAAYFQRKKYQREAPVFLTTIPIIFTLGDSGHVHVPLLVAPHGYSTYRGS